MTQFFPNTNKRAGLIPLKNMIEYEYVVRELIRALNVARARLRNTCERLLNGLVDNDDLAMLLDHTSLSEQTWNRPDIDQKLQDLLGDAYQPYMETVRLIVRKILEFSNKMGLDKRFKVSVTRSKSVVVL